MAAADVSSVPPTTLLSKHKDKVDVIFVDGPRGAGKSDFMRNKFSDKKYMIAETPAECLLVPPTLGAGKMVPHIAVEYLHEIIFAWFRDRVEAAREADKILVFETNPIYMKAYLRAMADLINCSMSDEKVISYIVENNIFVLGTYVIVPDKEGWGKVLVKGLAKDSHKDILRNPILDLHMSKEAYLPLMRKVYAYSSNNIGALFLVHIYPDDYDFEEIEFDEFAPTPKEGAVLEFVDGLTGGGKSTYLRKDETHREKHKIDENIDKLEPLLHREYPKGHIGGKVRQACFLDVCASNLVNAIQEGEKEDWAMGPKKLLPPQTFLVERHQLYIEYIFGLVKPDTVLCNKDGATAEALCNKDGTTQIIPNSPYLDIDYLDLIEEENVTIGRTIIVPTDLHTAHGQMLHRGRPSDFQWKLEDLEKISRRFDLLYRHMYDYPFVYKMTQEEYVEAVSRLNRVVGKI
jgi:hypothetical protein